MKERQRFDKIIESVRSRIEEEVGGLIGAELSLDSQPNSLVSKQEFFEQPLGRQVVARMDISGEIEGKGCLSVSVKDAIRLGGTLIMLPPSELESVISAEEYSGETEDSYGEIANIIAGAYTKAFEEMSPKSCRFVRKEQVVLSPVKVDIASADPVPDQLYCQVVFAMAMDGKPMGQMVMLVPAIPFGLAAEAPPAEPETGGPVEAAEAEQHGRTEAAASGEDEAGTEETGRTSVPESRAAERAEQPPPPEAAVPPEPAPATGTPHFDVAKHRKRIDVLLETCSKKVEEEVSALLGVAVSCSGLDNRLVSKENFFFDEASGKQVVANMDVVGDAKDGAYLYVGLKDAIRIGGILIMLPPNELEMAVSEEDFGVDSQDAYGEIANIIAGVYTAVFEEQYIKSVRFIKKNLDQLVPLKVDIGSEKPMPDRLYYMSSMRLAIGGNEYGKLQMLMPAEMLQLEALAAADDSAQTAEPAAPGDTEADSGERAETAAVTTAGRSTPQPGEGGADAEVLIVSDSDPDAEVIRQTLEARGMICRQLSFRDSIREYLPGTFKAVFLVMSTVDERSFGVAIKISSACSLPLIAAGSEWTRSKVIKAVKYGVNDILLTPAAKDDIEEKIRNNIVEMAA